jgi:hypothetical protein
MPEVLPGHAHLPPTWRPGETATVRFPGTIQSPEATIGAIPTPFEGAFAFPDALANVRVNGGLVRPPHHGYDETGYYVGEELTDDVRFPGPWNEGGTTLEWDPSPSGSPVTVSVRYLASGIETKCDGCTDCDPGFHCEPEDSTDPTSQRWCTADEGSSWLILGDVVCTVPDTGVFTLTSEHLEMLSLMVPPYYVNGAVLTIGRTVEGQLTVPDALTYNGKRAPLHGVRTRASDVIITRLDAPPPLPGLDAYGYPVE